MKTCTAILQKTCSPRPHQTGQRSFFLRRTIKIERPRIQSLPPTAAALRTREFVEISYSLCLNLYAPLSLRVNQTHC
jgi:hypothetical protein